MSSKRGAVVGGFLAFLSSGPGISLAGITHDVINSGTSAWAAAAQTGRSDMLILGDSVTWSGGYGWDHGMAKAAGETFGLAGTGLIGDSGATGQGYGAHTFGGIFSGNGFDTSIDAIPSDRQGYALRAGVPAVTAGATPLSGFSFSVGEDSSRLGGGDAYDWHLYTASAPGGGSLRGYRRIVSTDYGYFFNVVQSLPAVATATPANGLQHTVLHFDAAPTTPAGLPQELKLADVSNTSILYSRLVKPGATGVTVSSLGLGGNPTKNFYNQVYAAMSPQGRTAYLSNLVDGGTGKLNVMLAEGFNDRNDRTLSLNGVDFGYTPAGFRDNITTLIGLMRSDWAAAGKNAADLSFTLVGMYQDGEEMTTGLPSLLPGFAEVEMQLAAADPQISFVDLWHDAPGYLAAANAGYLADSVHPTSVGSDAYSRAIMAALVPEPTLFGLAALLWPLGRRRRSI